MFGEFGGPVADLVFAGDVDSANLTVIGISDVKLLCGVFVAAASGHEAATVDELCQHGGAETAGNAGDDNELRHFGMFSAERYWQFVLTYGMINGWRNYGGRTAAQVRLHKVKRCHMNARGRSEYLEFGLVSVIRPGVEFDSLYESDLADAGISVEMAAKLPAPLLVVDLRNVKFIGSAFLGSCVLISKHLESKPGGRFAICGLNTFARAAVTVAKLDRVLDVYGSCDEAVAALSRG